MSTTQWYSPRPDPGHFNCSTCKHINFPLTDRCGECGKCNACCDCMMCGGCRKRHIKSTMCPICKHCRRPEAGLRRCQCGGKPATFKGAIPTVTGADARKADVLRRAMTCEVEVSDKGLFESYYSSVPGVPIASTRDGSLPANGREYVVGPMAGTQFITGMNAALTKMHASGCRVADCCGLHVHVDARDYSAFDVRRLVLLYSKLEDGFFKLVTPRRSSEQCTYCKRLRHSNINVSKLQEARTSSEIRGALVKMLYPTSERESIRKVKGDKYQSARYCALNLHSWMHRGTVEFRHHHGCLQPERVTNWSLLCGWTVDLASRLSDRDVDSVGGMLDFVARSWKRNGTVLQLPEPVGTWVASALANPGDYGLALPDVPQPEMPRPRRWSRCSRCNEYTQNCVCERECSRCGYEDCRCCEECNHYPCECCDECGAYPCSCCGECNHTPCECEPEEPEESGDEDDEDQPF